MAARGRRGRQAEEEERVQGAEFQALASLVKELREELHYQRGKLEEQERRNAELSARLEATDVAAQSGPQLSIPSCSRGDFLGWERRETGQMLAAERPRQREVDLRIGSGRVEVTGLGYAVKPDTYDGEGNLEDFLSHFELVARANSWDESARALALATSLRGEARAVLQAFGDREEFLFAALKSRLELRYGERLNQQKSYTEFASRRQKVGEDLAVLAADLERLARTRVGYFRGEGEWGTVQGIGGYWFRRLVGKSEGGNEGSIWSSGGRRGFPEEGVQSRRQANYSGGKKPVLGKACCPGGRARLWKRGNVEPKKESERMLACSGVDAPGEYQVGIYNDNDNLILSRRKDFESNLDTHKTIESFCNLCRDDDILDNENDQEAANRCPEPIHITIYFKTQIQKLMLIFVQLC
ncbi:hypothetical protein M0804_013957 [Polistes exclamans]|nr:hypothetical protein M0804_013957 [Polistes exclamans]